MSTGSTNATQDLQTLVQGRLRDENEIERLVRTYADICDEDYDPERLSALFTEDAVWAASSEHGTSDFGVYHGRDAIREFFAGVSSQIIYAHHIVMSPEIDVTEPGRTARGRWNTIVMMHLRDDPYSEDEASVKMISAVYRHQYRKEDGRWLISRLDVHTRFDVRITAVLGNHRTAGNDELPSNPEK